MKTQKNKNNRTKKVANRELEFPEVSAEDWKKFETRRDALFSSAMLIMVGWILLAVVLGGIFGL